MGKLKEHFDVIVAGGGSAGVGAAVGSARCGARTLLMERYYCLGGASTMRNVLTGPFRFRGVFAVFDPEAVKVVLDDICQEADVTVMLRTMVVAADREDGMLAVRPACLLIRPRPGRRPLDSLPATAYDSGIPAPQTAPAGGQLSFAEETDMAKQGFKAMDSDMHVFEPHDLWDRYIDPEFKDRAPKGLQRDFRDLGVEVEGKILPIPRRPENPGLRDYRLSTLKEKYSDVAARNFDGVSQVMAMDKEGLDVAFLFPTRGLFVLGIDGLDPELAAAISRAYNDWLYDFSQAAPDRMVCVAMVPPQNVEAAVAETKRTVNEKGFRGVFMRPNQTNGLCWSDPYYDPLWEVCQDLNVPVGFHEAGRVYQPQPAISQFIPSFSMFNTLSFPLANMFACADMIYGGVMERFPKLRVAFLEGNCSWLPWLLYRMGDYMESVGKAEYPDLKLEPLEYFQRQCFGAVECDEITARNIPDFGLEDNVVFSTDYPHLDVKYPHSLDTFLEMPFSDESKRKYLWDNCARLYNMGQ